MALLKNPGPPLVSEFYGDVENIPREFRAKIGIRKTVQQQPVDVLPEDLVDEIIQSSVVQERTDERAKTVTELIGDLDTELIDEVFIPETGQLGTRTRTLAVEGTELVPDALTHDAEQHNLGNGFLDQVVTEVDEVFPSRKETKTRPDVTPQDFAALLQSDEFAVTDDSIYGPPDDLGAGEYERTTEELTEFHTRSTLRSRDLLELPAVINNSRSNKFKQVEEITRSLVDEITTPALPTATRDVEFTKLGDGTALEVLTDVDEPFEELVTSVEVPDLLPDLFKALLPTSIRENTEEGIVDDPPTLLTGEFARTESQVDVFNKRIRIRGRPNISYPTGPLVSGGYTSDKFGGGILYQAATIDDAVMIPDEGLLITDSKVTNLGNGTWTKISEALLDIEWPTLLGQYFDKEMQVDAFTEEQTVDPTYTLVPDTYAVESLKPIDKWRSKRIKLIREPTAISLASALEEEVDGPFQFPGLIYLAPGGGGYFRRQASAQLCQQIIRTWWMSSATKPTRGLPGSGADVEVQDIIMDDIVISTLNDVSVLAYSGPALHDAITTFGVFVYAATEPDATTYIGLIGSEIVVGASIEPTDIPELWKIQTKSVVAR